MKCTKIQRVILEHDADELTAEITTHIESCPVCGRVYRRSCTYRKVIALKRYEQPSELRREACVSRLHAELASSWGPGRRLSAELHPALRYGVAAAVLIMAGAHMAAIQQAPALHSPIVQSDLVPTRSFGEWIQELQPPLPQLAGQPPMFQTFVTNPTNLPAPSARPNSVFFIKE